MTHVPGTLLAVPETCNHPHRREVGGRPCEHTYPLRVVRQLSDGSYVTTSRSGHVRLVRAGEAWEWVDGTL